jgi:hypothetical protein
MGLTHTSTYVVLFSREHLAELEAKVDELANEFESRAPHISMDLRLEGDKRLATLRGVIDLIQLEVR